MQRNILGSMSHEKGFEENRPQTMRISVFNVGLGVGEIKWECSSLFPKSYPFNTHLSDNYGFTFRPAYFGKKLVLSH